MLSNIILILFFTFAVGSAYFMYKINQISRKYSASNVFNIWDDMAAVDKKKIKQYFKKNLILLFVILLLIFLSYRLFK